MWGLLPPLGQYLPESSLPSGALSSQGVHSAPGSRHSAHCVSPWSVFLLFFWVLLYPETSKIFTACSGQYFAECSGWGPFAGFRSSPVRLFLISCPSDSPPWLPWTQLTSTRGDCLPFPGFLLPRLPVRNSLQAVRGHL